MLVLPWEGGAGGNGGSGCSWMGLRTQGGYRVHESESVSRLVLSDSLPSQGL